MIKHKMPHVGGFNIFNVTPYALFASLSKFNVACKDNNKNITLCANREYLMKS